MLGECLKTLHRPALAASPARDGQLAPSCVGPKGVWLRFYALRALLKSNPNHICGFFRGVAAPEKPALNLVANPPVARFAVSSRAQPSDTLKRRGSAFVPACRITDRKRLITDHCLSCSSTKSKFASKPATAATAAWPFAARSSCRAGALRAATADAAATS